MYFDHEQWRLSFIVLNNEMRRLLNRAPQERNRGAYENAKREWEMVENERKAREHD